MKSKKQILEKIHRMNYLMSYEKGRVISEQKISILNEDPNTTNQTTQDPKTMGKYKVTGTEEIKKSETINVTFSKAAKYAVKSFDPSSFINDFITEIINKLKTQNPDNKPLNLDSITVTAGASNIWNSKKTYYDVENDYTTKNPNQKPPTDTGYDGNIALAGKRANTFWTNLKTLLLQRTDPPKIKIADTVVPTLKSLVVNTNGVQDEVNQQRNKNANPGQFISLSMNFSFVVETTEFKETTVLKEGIVETSTYWCDGTDGKGQWRPKYTGGCATNNVLQTPKTILGGKNEKPAGQEATKNGAGVNNILHNFITIYQLIFQNQRGTWKFKWTDGKISSIMKEVTGNMGKDPTTGQPQIIKGSGEIKGNEALLTELRNAMNFPKYEGGKVTEKTYRQSYESFVGPYL